MFTGISLSPDVEIKLAAVLKELRPLAPINWSPVENLHITCKFIGVWPENGLADLTAALERIPVSGSIPIHISGFGCFPNARRPHSLFADVKAEPSLVALAKAIDAVLKPMGCKPEDREYRPHVTLARIKNQTDIRGLQQRIADYSDSHFGGFDCRQFHLYLSRPESGRSVYTKLATYDLMREKNENS